MKSDLRVRDVLEKDPTRQINPVIQVDLRDPRRVGLEFEEYVVTAEIKRALQDIIDRFIDRRGKPDTVCGWISGFFGSGKSHFLKFLGYLLSNEKILLEDGREVGTTEYFCRIHELNGGAILSRELKTKSIFVNMLNFPRDSRESPSILSIVYTTLRRDQGFSEVPWLAETELMIKERGLWEKFIEYIREKTGRDWSEERRAIVRARPLLVDALCAIDPKVYYSREIAEQSINDAERSFSLTPDRLTEALVEEAKHLDEENGRVVVLLDEVGLYVGNNTERMLDLQAIAEAIDRLGNGRVWLFVTSQEAIEEKIPQVERTKDQFEKIRDRFRIRVKLTTENIDTVVKKRLLSKTPDPHKIGELRELYQRSKGQLATSAILKDPARDPGRLLTWIDENNFIESYPLMPYYVILMQDIFGALRSRGRGGMALTGRERSVLSVVRAMLGDPSYGLADKPLGTLATFDTVYNAIESELDAIRSEQIKKIKETEGLGTREDLKVGSVAKALFLLQQIGEWIPCTVENISAVLYPYLGADGTELRHKVEMCLEALKDSKLVTEESGKWRFLSDIERSFESDVDGEIVSMSEKKKLISELVGGYLRDKFKSYNYEGIRTFDIKISLDDEEITSKGHIKLFFYSPLYNYENEKNVYVKSIAEKDGLFLISGEDDGFERKLERAIQIEHALSKRQIHTSEEEMELKKYRNEVDRLKEEIPEIFERVCATGALIIHGEKTKLDGKKSVDVIVRSQIKKIIDQQFTQFEHAKCKVEKDEHIGAILRGGELPQVYKDLKLVDNKGNISIEGAVASAVLQEVKNRKEQGESCDGAYLIDHFDSEPYGWDQKIVRLVLATLFKNGSVGVKLDGREILPSDSGAAEVFTNSRNFNRAEFFPSIEVSPEERDKAWSLLSEIFGKRADDTLEAIDEKLQEALAEKTDLLNRMYGKASALGLPIANDLKELQDAVNEVRKASDPNRRILKFLEVAGTLKDRIPLLDGLAGFDEKGKIQEYSKIKDFIRICGGSLSNADTTQREGVIGLSQMLSGRDFMNRWTEIVKIYDSLRSRYDELYRELHTKRNDHISKAIEELRKEVPEKDIETAVRELREMMCDSLELDDGTFSCRSCKATLESLRFAEHYINDKEEEIRRRFQRGTGAPPVARTEGFSEEIRTDADVEAVTDKLKKTADKAVREGKRVHVDVRVE